MNARFRRVVLGLALVVPGVAIAACGGGDSDSGGVTASSTASAMGGAGGAPASTTSTSQGGGSLFSSAGTGGNGAGGADVCVGVGCPNDQHCEADNGAGVCVDNTCAELNCTATEVCETTPGGGAVCKDNTCASDADCVANQYCNGAICVADVCAPGTRTCVGNDLHECAANGGSESVKYTCGSQAYFTSQCADDGTGTAYCPCEDDWDCPANTTCEAGKCNGTGKAPTCTLAPQPFSSVLPVNEIQWGGTGTANKSAVNSPFPASSQACATPIVANLDDDNGDGLINELDFPEIVFMTYCNSDVTDNGVVRAIHGGGPNKGKDMWATCGSTVWHEGDPLDMPCVCGDAVGNSTSALAVGDLDGDGVPEVVVLDETFGVLLLDNKGNQIARTAADVLPASYSVPAPTIANLDGKGLAEIVVGNVVFTLDHDPQTNKIVFLDRFAGNLANGKNGQGPVSCIANVAGDSRQEIIAGTTVYALPTPPPGVTKRADCAVGAMDNFCTGVLDVVWNGQTVNGTTGPTGIPNANKDGFCAVADVLGVDPMAAPGPNNPLDGKPEVILVSAGKLLILDGETGVLYRTIDLVGVGNGGAPNVDDFDGDGFPEIGTALGTNYVVIDLQDPTPNCPAWPNTLDDAMSGNQGNPVRNPGGACAMDTDCNAGGVCNPILGQCTCLYNGWKRKTEDDSSAVTGSSVFDFNGDGAAEVVYNDECYFRIYDGKSGDVLFKHHSPSRTRIENPAIADVDNDGNAEIVFPSNNEAAACSEGDDYPNGIAVWGDASDSWVSARRIWNEHAYHVTNVTEGGALPTVEPESWKTYNGRRYNTYRSNPRNYSVAPDLTVKGVQVSSPDAACGQLSTKLTINVQIDNIGDLRVGPGVAVTFYGNWNGGALTEPLYDATMTPLSYALQGSLEPGGSVVISVDYDAIDNSPMTLPDSIRVVVDEANAERECDETNNDLTQPVQAGNQEADLRVELGAIDTTACPTPTIVTTVFNDGSIDASNVVVRYYAGNPSQGGMPFHDETIPGPIAAGGMVTIIPTLTGFPPNAAIVIYAQVDPDNTIPECNDGNNGASASGTVNCTSIN